MRRSQSHSVLLWKEGAPCITSLLRWALLLAIVSCHAAGVVHRDHSNSNNSTHRDHHVSSAKASTTTARMNSRKSATTSTSFSSSTSSTRPFAPVLDEHGQPGRLFFYERSPDIIAVKYYDPVGLIDWVVPRHFPGLSTDRVVYELRWNAQTGKGNWTERTTLELLYHSLMEPPIRDDSIFGDQQQQNGQQQQQQQQAPHYHPKAALKQQQRNQYYHSLLGVGVSGGAPASMNTHRRTYQQHLRENAIAAAAAHRAGMTATAAGAVTSSGSMLGDTSSVSSSGISSSSGGSSSYGVAASPPLIVTETRKMKSAYGWLRDDIDICEWEGVACGDFTASSQYYWNKGGIMTTRDPSNVDEATMSGSQARERWSCDHCPYPPPSTRVTKVELPYAGLVGTLPTELFMLRYLHRLDLRGNNIYGSLPTTLPNLEYLQYLDLTRNNLTGMLLGDPKEEATKPLSTSFPPNIREVWLGSNQFHGTVPLNLQAPLLVNLDVSKNRLTGSLPRYGRKQMPKLKLLFLEDNQLTGKLPPKWVGMTDLEVMDVGGNSLNGTIPTIFGTFVQLREFNIVGNSISGTLPTEILKLTNLQALMVSENQLHGSIPGGDDTVPHRAMRDPEAGYKWSQLTDLQFLHASDNFLTSTLPPDLFYGLAETLESLDLSYNDITGTMPQEIATCSHLERINLQANRIQGTLPTEMSRMNPNLELNFTNNLLTGSIPTMFCGGGPTSMNFLYRQFACDAVLCPPRTFHPTGGATLHSGCRRCPTTPEGEKRDPPESKLLGRTRCGTEDIYVVNGDVDGDGVVSAREVLRLLFVETIGRFWGQHFQNWIDLTINECDLHGVTCVNGAVAKLDLVNAGMCSNGDHKSGLVPDCRGLPTELARLDKMEILTLSRRQFLMGTLPTEIGLMTKLKYIDISECPYMSGPLPSELGRLTNLKFFNVIGSSFNQAVPTEIFHLTSLEKLHLSNNIFTGTLPPDSIGQMENIKELFYSNNYIHGTIPRQTGNLSKLENIEMYGNELNGTLPDTLSRCTNLKRIDVFSNQLTGAIPNQLASIESIQIMHLKMNRLTGTIPAKYGELPYLSWFDVSHNLLHGTIPATFGQSRSIKDFRLGGNMFYDPIPPSLCANTNVNGGLATAYGCDGVICPLGTYSDSGHATPADGGCKKCPVDETTMYLGSSECQPFSPEDFLSILFDAMQGEQWPEELRENWKNRHVDVCYWSGVICDTNGDIVSIGFPTAWNEWQ